MACPPRRNVDNAARLFVGGKNDLRAAAPLAETWMEFGKWFVQKTHLAVKARNHDNNAFFDRFDRFEKMFIARMLEFYTSTLPRRECLSNGHVAGPRRFASGGRSRN
jgi:hypothetical protein